MHNKRETRVVYACKCSHYHILFYEVCFGCSVKSLISLDHIYRIYPLIFDMVWFSSIFTSYDMLSGCQSKIDYGLIARKKEKQLYMYSCMKRNYPCDGSCAGNWQHYVNSRQSNQYWFSVLFFVQSHVMNIFLFSSWVLFICFILYNTITFHFPPYNHAPVFVVLQMFL